MQSEENDQMNDCYNFGWPNQDISDTFLYQLDQDQEEQIQPPLLLSQVISQQRLSRFSSQIEEIKVEEKRSSMFENFQQSLIFKEEYMLTYHSNMTSSELSIPMHSELSSSSQFNFQASLLTNPAGGLKKDTLLKVDYGFKKLLRGARSTFKFWFDELHCRSEQYKWNKDLSLWFLEVKEFLIHSVQLQDVSDRDVWASVLLISPILDRPSRSKLPKQKKRDKICSESEKNSIKSKLGEKGIKLFKGIFKKNTKNDVQQFFRDSFVIKLWPLLMPRLDEQQILKSNNRKKNEYDLTETFCKITLLFKSTYGLPLPGWWQENYPPLEIPLIQKRILKKRLKAERKF